MTNYYSTLLCFYVIKQHIVSTKICCRFVTKSFTISLTLSFVFYSCISEPPRHLGLCATECHPDASCVPVSGSRSVEVANQQQNRQQSKANLLPQNIPLAPQARASNSITQNVSAPNHRQTRSVDNQIKNNPELKTSELSGDGEDPQKRIAYSLFEALFVDQNETEVKTKNVTKTNSLFLKNILSMLVVVPDVALPANETDIILELPNNNLYISEDTSSNNSSIENFSLSLEVEESSAFKDITEFAELDILPGPVAIVPDVALPLNKILYYNETMKGKSSRISPITTVQSSAEDISHFADNKPSTSDVRISFHNETTIVHETSTSFTSGATTVSTENISSVGPSNGSTTTIFRTESDIQHTTNNASLTAEGRTLSYKPSTTAQETSTLGSTSTTAENIKFIGANSILDESNATRENSLSLSVDTGSKRINSLTPSDLIEQLSNNLEAIRGLDDAAIQNLIAILSKVRPELREKLSNSSSFELQFDQSLNEAPRMPQNEKTSSEPVIPSKTTSETFTNLSISNQNGIQNFSNSFPNNLTKSPAPQENFHSSNIPLPAQTPVNIPSLENSMQPSKGNIDSLHVGMNPNSQNLETDRNINFSEFGPNFGQFSTPQPDSNFPIPPFSSSLGQPHPPGKIPLLDGFPPPGINPFSGGPPFGSHTSVNGLPYIPPNFNGGNPIFENFGPLPIQRPPTGEIPHTSSPDLVEDFFHLNLNPLPAGNIRVPPQLSGQQQFPQISHEHFGASKSNINPPNPFIGSSPSYQCRCNPGFVGDGIVSCLPPGLENPGTK